MFAAILSYVTRILDKILFRIRNCILCEWISLNFNNKKKISSFTKKIKFKDLKFEFLRENKTLNKYLNDI
jgi:hypothetical protein